MKSVIDTKKKMWVKKCSDFNINKYLCIVCVVFTLQLLSGGLTPALLRMYSKFLKVVFGKWEKSKFGISGILIFWCDDERRITPALWGNDSVDLLLKLQLQGRSVSQQCSQIQGCMSWRYDKIECGPIKSLFKRTLRKCHCIKIRLLSAAAVAPATAVTLTTAS